MVNKQNIKNIQDEINDQTIIAATKYVDASAIEDLVKLGINNIGENRVDAFLEKYNVLHDYNIVWHFIGHLQSKKVKKVINKVDYLHSLDRISLADEIQKHRTLPLKCFIEINISDEQSKYGLNVNDVYSFCEKLESYDKILIVGLMGMAKLTDDETEISNEFGKLREIKEELNKRLSLNIDFLSMGMSNDYKIAIKEGSTHLRLGSILFGKED
ncbi:MAG: YggS family pyridoxal phosphate-dependent enzyme [Tenericutes bacterium]|nr:YggS family pyridoxal phosphate-dependent enzyme [Mycoplasmatota bacterium]